MDSRWAPWLGCWQSDTSDGERKVSPSTTCIVPVAGSTGVDALTILHGKVIVRDRLEANGRPHDINGQGCQGWETVNWSTTGRRVYLRSDYTCGSTKGSSTTIFALSSAGEWLRVDEVRSGGGAIVTVDRLRETDVAAEVPPDAARSLARQRLAITTARAAAATPITVDEIVDAVRSVDASVVRSWMLASGQRFNFDERQLLILAHADTPPSVMQALMGNSDRVASNNQSTNEYLNTPVYTPPVQQAPAYPQQMQTMYVCPPNGCSGQNQYSEYNGGGYNPYMPYTPYSPYNQYAYPYPYPYYSAPVFFTNGVNRQPFRQPQRGHDGTHGGHGTPGPHASPPVVRGPVGRRP